MNETEEQLEKPTIQGFDYRTVIRDPRTGKLIREQHYKRHVSAQHGEFLERDGKFYHPGSNTETIPDPRIRKEEPVQTVVEAKLEKKPEVSFTKKA